MFINKIGQYHLDNGLNCQDYGFNAYDELNKKHFKLVCDGCSEAKTSEVGAILFSSKLEQYTYDSFDRNWDESFESVSNKIINKMIELYPFDHYLNCSDEKIALKIINMYTFTILSVTETMESFFVHFCGDGYIILQDNCNNISFRKIDDGEYPKYYIYNYIDSRFLDAYRNGVKFENEEYSKSEYKRVGVASDGIRFILDSVDINLRDEFIDLIKNDKEVKLKRFINKNQHIFKDDITISW